jgi:hypothetical protein
MGVTYAFDNSIELTSIIPPPFMFFVPKDFPDIDIIELCCTKLTPTWSSPSTKKNNG